MKEYEMYMIAAAATVLLGLILLIYMMIWRKSGGLRRWAVQELLLIGTVLVFGEICTTALKQRDAAGEARLIWTMGGMIAALGTFLISFLVFQEGRRMKKLTEAFANALKGTGQMDEKPLFLDKEMDSLWNGAWVCARTIERQQYQQLSQQRIYSRFIPMAAERLFCRRELEDVTAGDYILQSGIIGCISVQTDLGGGREEYHDVKNQISDLFLKTQEEGNSVFFPQSGDLKKLWGIFLDRAEDAVHTGIRVLTDIEEKRLNCDVTMLLSPSDYTYGITGNKTRVLPYFSADHGEELLFYSERLRELGVKLAVTKEMAEGFADSMSLRGIGYIEVAGKKRDLCEVLEAYPVSKRCSMERQKGKFARALDLYYRSDFYLARNIFAEILRECPGDNVAKWYLFACENRLGNLRSAGAGYGLFDRGERDAAKF